MKPKFIGYIGQLLNGEFITDAYKNVVVFDKKKEIEDYAFEHKVAVGILSLVRQYKKRGPKPRKINHERL